MAEVNLIAQAAHDAAPFVKIDLNTIANGFIAVMVGMGVRRMGAIRDHLAKLNGSVGELKQWREDHQEAEGKILNGLERGEVECKAQMRRELDKLWVQVGDRRVNRQPPESD